MMQTVFPGCAFELTVSSVPGLDWDVPLPVPVGDAHRLQDPPELFETVTDTDAVADELPAASYDFTPIVWLPFASAVVSREYDHGDAVSEALTLPST